MGHVPRAACGVSLCVQRPTNLVLLSRNFLYQFRVFRWLYIYTYTFDFLYQHVCIYSVPCALPESWVSSSSLLLLLLALGALGLYHRAPCACACVRVVRWSLAPSVRPSVSYIYLLSIIDLGLLLLCFRI